MPSWRTRLLIVLLLALVSVPSVPVSAEDDSTGASGFVFLEIDGLSEPGLRAALEAGAMPFLDGLIDDGSHTLGSWRTTAATTTTVTQAGLLHGHWRGTPGFRWWDRETGQPFDLLDFEQSRRFQERIQGPADLLADGGASITNLFAGGAPRVVLTSAYFEGAALPWGVGRYLLDLPKVVHVVNGFVDGIAVGLIHTFRGEAVPFSDGVKRKVPVPVLGPALEWALVEVASAAVVRELQWGTPLIYATFQTYDEVSHYAGPDHPTAIGALTHLDRELAFIAAAAEAVPRRYHVVVLSDHGQTRGEPFALRYGETLTGVVQGLLSGDTGEGDQTQPPELVVAASGNLAHVYLRAQGARLDAAEIEEMHPGLMAGLAAHPGIGAVVVVTEDDGLLALGGRGSHELLSGQTDGRDPAAQYGPLGALSLLNIGASPDAGDLVVVSTYDPVADAVHSFEEQVSSHGGLGGPQMEPFLLYPSELEGDAEPLHIEGLDDLRAKIDEWLGAGR